MSEIEKKCVGKICREKRRSIENERMLTNLVTLLLILERERERVFVYFCVRERERK